MAVCYENIDIGPFCEDDPDYLRMKIKEDLERKVEILNYLDNEVKKKQEELENEINDAFETFAARLKSNAKEVLYKTAQELLEKHKQEREFVTNFEQEHSDVLDGATANDEEHLQELKDILKQLSTKDTKKKSTIAVFKLDKKMDELESTIAKMVEVVMYEEDSCVTVNDEDCSDYKLIKFNYETNLIQVQDSKNEVFDNKKENSLVRHFDKADNKILNAELDTFSTLSGLKKSKERNETSEDNDASAYTNKNGKTNVKLAEIKVESFECHSDEVNDRELSKTDDRSLQPERSPGLLTRLFTKLRRKPKPDKSTTASGKDVIASKTGTQRETNIKKSKSEFWLEVYSDVNFENGVVIISSALVNTAKSISGLSPGYKFEQLVDLENGKLCLFSPQTNTIAVVKLEKTTASLCCEKVFEENKSKIVKTGPNTVGLLSEVRQNVEICKVEEKNILNEEIIPIKDCCTDITGFDFNGSDKFAITSPSKVLVVSRTGRTIEKKDYTEVSNVDSTKLRTIYDFENKVVYVLNTERATLKRMKVRSKTAAWKNQMDTNLAVRNFSVHMDKICVVSKDKISIFSAIDGSPLLQQDTSNLIKDSLGIYVTDNVIIVTSNPCEYAQNTMLAFKGF